MQPILTAFRHDKLLDFFHSACELNSRALERTAFVVHLNDRDLLISHIFDKTKVMENYCAVKLQGNNCAVRIMSFAAKLEFATITFVHMEMLPQIHPDLNPRNSMTTYSKLLPIFGTALLLVACKSAPKLDVATTSKSEPVPVSIPMQAPAPVAASMVAKVVVPDHLDPNSSLSKNRSVFFDYDDFSVKKEFSSIVENHAKYASANSKLAVKVEGNADERGGREYNLALGQKRAEAVVRAMKIYGAKDAQLEAVSYGSEKPKAPGHDETSWAQNRRADILYQSK